MSTSSQSDTSISTAYSGEAPSPPRPSSDLPDPYNSRDSDRNSSGREELYPHIRARGLDGSSDVGSTDRNISLEARRMNLIAADRKRRLTDTADGSGRRRTHSGGFHGQETNQELIAPSSSAHHPGSSMGLPEITPRTTGFRQESMRGPLLSQLHRRSDGSPRNDHVLPKWQPDAEATTCPICGIHFTWYFRKHHCRKCGRVVCSNCSPHRITIPRQFIVHPPDQSQRTSLVEPSQLPNVVDLTGDEEGPSNERPTLRRPGSSQYSDPALGGGEEVRLCNPCVPDPQPEPQSFDATNRPTSTAHWPRHSDLGLGFASMGQSNPYAREDTASWLVETARIEKARREMNRRRAQGMNFSPEGRSNDPTRRRPSEILDENFLAHGRLGAAEIRQGGIPSAYRDQFNGLGNPTYSSTPPARGPSLFGSMPTPSHLSRQPQPMFSPSSSTSSRSVRQAPEFTTHRPRGHSMLDGPPSSRRMVAMFEDRPSHSPRPRLTERDICPICRRPLPPIGSDGDETGREQHVMQCISARDPTYIPPTSPSPPGSSANDNTSHPLPNPSPSQQELPGPTSVSIQQQTPPSVYLLPFIATEKDCLQSSDESTPPECSICMIEYEVGDRLARLDCLCKFHEECIVGWFRRKRECPVHSMH